MTRSHSASQPGRASCPPALLPPPFPLALFRRIHFGAGAFCPRCGNRRVQRWGRFGWRQRYRCTGCGRTFSDFTGTPLAYLKRVEHWPAFCGAFPRALSVRASARRLGLHKDTMFRWRRRLLGSLRRTEHIRLVGRVSVGQTWFPVSYKGSRRLPRPPRRRRFEGLSWQTEAAWVVLAADRNAATLGATIGTVVPSLVRMRLVLAERIGRGSVILSRTGRFGFAGAFAAGEGLRWQREPAIPPREDGWPEAASALARRLKAWLRRFRGVATKYLDEYLVWFRLVDLAQGRTRPPRPLASVLTRTFP